MVKGRPRRQVHRSQVDRVVGVVNFDQNHNIRVLGSIYNESLFLSLVSDGQMHAIGCGDGSPVTHPEMMEQLVLAATLTTVVMRADHSAMGTIAFVVCYVFDIADERTSVPLKRAVYWQFRGQLLE